MFLQVLTVRPTAFEAASGEGGSASVEDASAGSDVGLSSWVSNELSSSDRPELASAKVHHHQ